MFSLLSEKLISSVAPDGGKRSDTLPGVLSGLVSDKIASFPSLRPHQRHVWHAFLVQVATLAMQKAGTGDLPDEKETWCQLLANLTPEWPNGEPWSLVVDDIAKPALLQPPVPGAHLSAFKRIETPDALDMLITAKNHDLKAERMRAAAAEDWLFALLSLQTQEGVMGAGNYGISRMNGGYGSRPGFGLELNRSYGFAFRRDVALLLASRNEAGNAAMLRQDGMALLWLEPWDGVTAIPFEKLHPLYIEICRRVRLGVTDGQINCQAAGSAAARISGAAELKGDTGDPWMPISIGGKGLSLGGEGLSYRKLAELLHPGKFKLPILAKAGGNEPQEDLVWVGRSVCRGQGKTEGYHERRIPLSKRALAVLATRQEAVAGIAESHVMALNELRLALRFALHTLNQGAPEKVATDKVTSKRFAEPWLAKLEREAEQTFFEDLWDEAGAEETERSSILDEWLKKQRLRGQQLLIEAAGSMPQPITRRYIALAQAEIAFRGKLARTAAFASIFNEKKLSGNQDDEASHSAP